MNCDSVNISLNKQRSALELNQTPCGANRLPSGARHRSGSHPNKCPSLNYLHSSKADCIHSKGNDPHHNQGVRSLNLLIQDQIESRVSGSCYQVAAFSLLHIFQYSQTPRSGLEPELSRLTAGRSTFKLPRNKAGAWVSNPIHLDTESLETTAVFRPFPSHFIR